jgi:hypothetical protein
MEGKVFRNADEVEYVVCSSRSDVTSDEVQLVFHAWTRRLKWLSERRGDSGPAYAL